MMPERKKKILMISFHTAQSLGLRSIATLLKKKYTIHYLYFVNLVNIHFKSARNKIPLSLLSKFSKKYDYIFISSTSYNKMAVFRVANTIKAANPESKVIIGGNLTFHEPLECVEHADFVCIWEGHTILELLEQIESKKRNISVANFISKENTEARYSMPDNLDMLIPDYSKDNNYFLYHDKIIKKEFCPKKLSFRTSLGCIYGCTFCYVNHINKIKAEHKLPLYQEMSIKQVINGLERIKKITGPNEVRIVDENFLYRDLGQIREFIKEYNKRIDLPLQIDVDARSKDFLEKFEAMADIRKQMKILFGVQTGSEKFNAEVYHRIQKNSLLIKNHDRMLEIIRQKKANIKIIYTFIFCNPLEDKETVLDSINLMLKLKKSSIMICNLSLMPGTELKEMLSNHYSGLNHLGEINYGYFRRFGFYYFLYFVIKLANLFRLDSLLPEKIAKNSVTEFMNKDIFSRVYYFFITLIYKYYELEMKIRHGSI